MVLGPTPRHSHSIGSGVRPTNLHFFQSSSGVDVLLGLGTLVMFTLTSLTVQTHVKISHAALYEMCSSKCQSFNLRMAKLEIFWPFLVMLDIFPAFGFLYR